MATSITPTLKRGARVRFIGTVCLRVPFGTEGLVTGQDRDRWVVDFPLGTTIEQVKLHRSEMDVLPDADACACGHTGADHFVESLLSTHSCIRCECQMFEPAPPRFTATVHDGVPTVRDNQTSKVIRHKGVWTEAFAADVARDLELTPGTAHLLTWEDAA